MAVWRYKDYMLRDWPWRPAQSQYTERPRKQQWHVMNKRLRISTIALIHNIRTYILFYLRTHYLNSSLTNWLADSLTHLLTHLLAHSFSLLILALRTLRSYYVTTWLRARSLTYVFLFLLLPWVLLLFCGPSTGRVGLICKLYLLFKMMRHFTLDGCID